jgi:hypothetical protein
MSGMDVFYLHAGAMVLGFLFMSAGVGIARFQRRKRWWLKAHKSVTILSGLYIAGII